MSADLNLLPVLRPRPPWARWAVVAAGCALTLGHAGMVGVLARRVAAAERQVVSSSPDPAAVRQEVEALNRVRRASGFAWSVFLDRLETVVPPTVSLLTIEPVFERPLKVTVTALARSEDDVAAFFDRLAASRWFRQPFIPRSDWRAGQGLMQFTMTFEYHSE